MSEIPVSVIKGFLIPEYTNERTGEHTFSNREDFDKVRLGYACAVCLCEFSCYMVRCPLCGNERDIHADLGETPADIQAYYDAANGSGEKTVAEPMHRTIERLTRSADMDHIPLKKLRPSRWGVGG